MGSNTFTETTSQGWGSRIGGSIKGIFFGFILIGLALILLFWNEGRAVKRARTLDEGGGAVISVNPGTVNAGNEAKLVHVSGMTEVDGSLVDPLFGVTSTALKLKRVVEMYQWQERSTSETRKKLGGGTETVTTYDYDKVWSERLIDSNTFKVTEDHQNPSTMAYQTTEWTADQVNLGSFTLSPSLVARIDSYTGLGLEPDAASKTTIPVPIAVDAGRFYIGNTPSSPRISDMKVSFSVVLPTEVSIVARQTQNTFEPFLTRAGGSIELLQTGIASAESMFQSAHASNNMTTWILRALGLFLMFLGLKMLLAPLVVLADVLPIAGTIVGAGVGIVALLTALAITFATIAVAWIFYRPLIGITLLALALAVVALVARKLLKNKAVVAAER